MLTPRESAAGMFTSVRSMGTRQVRGVDHEALTCERLDLLEQAERAINRALAGPAPCFAVEPDDTALRAMLHTVEQRRAAVAATT